MDGVTDAIGDLGNNPLFDCLAELATVAKGCNDQSSHSDNVAVASQLKLLIAAVKSELPNQIKGLEMGLDNLAGKVEQIK